MRILYILPFLILCNLCESKNIFRPNIIFILADDLGWGDVSFHGSMEIPTPNIDLLARDGIVMHNYYGLHLCTPSRGSLLTGKYPIFLGLQNYVIKNKGPWGLSPQEMIFSQYFNELGYESHGVGKWHLGFFEKKYIPSRRGFKSFFGYWTGLEDYYTHYSSTASESGLDLYDNEVIARGYNGSYGTDLFTNKAKQIIENHDGKKPLFLYLAQQAVHTGCFCNDSLQAPKSYIDRFPYVRDDNRKTYAGMLYGLDQCVGEILSSLEKARMLNESILVFVSDNGAPVQGLDFSAGSNYPLRGTKYNLWEGGVRLPAFIWSSDLRLQSRIDRQLIHVSDWLPTLYAAAGADVRRLGSIDGRNLWPSILYNEASPREEILLNSDPVWKTAALRKKQYKLVKGSALEGKYDFWYNKNGIKMQPNENADHKSSSVSPMAYRQKRSYRRALKNCKVAEILCRNFQQQITGESPSYEEWQKQLTVKCGAKLEAAEFKCDANETSCLFDIDQDPCEYHNIARLYPEIVKEMECILANYEAKSVPVRNKPDDPDADPKRHCDEWVSWKEPGITC